MLSPFEPPPVPSCSVPEAPPKFLRVPVSSEGHCWTCHGASQEQWSVNDLEKLAPGSKIAVIEISLLRAAKANEVPSTSGCHATAGSIHSPPAILAPLPTHETEPFASLKCLRKDHRDQKEGGTMCVAVAVVMDEVEGGAKRKQRVRRWQVMAAHHRRVRVSLAL